jgi:hypothetical protein
MPKSNILAQLEIALPIMCQNAKCKHAGEIFNAPVIPANEEDSFFEEFGHGGEDEDSDNCPICKELGILQDPMDLLIYSIQNQDEPLRYVAMRFSPEFIDSLMGLLNNFQEGTAQPVESTFGVESAGFDYMDSFHVFDALNFGVPEFDFSAPQYDETDKYLVCSRNRNAISVRLVCEFRLPGADIESVKKIQTCSFTKDDLLALRGWLNRNETSPKKR